MARLWDPMYIVAAVVFALVMGALALGGVRGARGPTAGAPG